MRIQYMSDLHMEFAENSRYIKHCGFPVTGEVLVLAGDTFYLEQGSAIGEFLELGLGELQTGVGCPRQP